MDLQADAAGCGQPFIGLGVVDCLHAVEPELNVAAFGADRILVPPAGLEGLPQHIGLRSSQHPVAA